MEVIEHSQVVFKRRAKFPIIFGAQPKWIKDLHSGCIEWGMRLLESAEEKSFRLTVRMMTMWWCDDNDDNDDGVVVVLADGHDHDVDWSSLVMGRMCWLTQI